MYPEAQEQRCWNHRIVNVLTKIPKRAHQLRQIPYAESRQEAEREGLLQWSRDSPRRLISWTGTGSAWGPFTTIPRNNGHLPFSGLRLRTDAARRFKQVSNAQAVIWKMLLVAEKRFRRLKDPHLTKDVYRGAQFEDGVAIQPATEEKAA